MVRTYKLLDEDKVWIENRLEFLNRKIKDLGEEFHEVLNQSSETWHDNAPFDAVVDKQSLLYAEYSHLKHIILNSKKIVSSKSHSKVQIGQQVTVSKSGTKKIYYIAGDWSYLTGKLNKNGALVVTCQTPLAQALIDKSVGENTAYGIIEDIN